MDHTDPQEFDLRQTAVSPSQDAIAPPAGGGEVDLVLGYEAAVPWLQQPQWCEDLRGELLAENGR
jgi:hypothetical protein